jgi:hypothetical protein
MEPIQPRQSSVSNPAGAPHFRMRFRPVAQSQKPEEKSETPQEANSSDETLILDPRGRLRPSEHVERKLWGLLGDAVMPVSFLRVPESSEL